MSNNYEHNQARAQAQAEAQYNHDSVMYTDRITKPVVNWLVLGSTVSFVDLIYLSLIS